MSDKVTEGNSPEDKAKPKAIIDPTHPQAGRGGVVPPEHSRIKPGQVLNPGGRPKGYSPRAALRRMLAAQPNEHGEGAEAAALAERVMNIAQSIAGGGMDHDKALKVLEAQLKVLEQVDGKPKETIEHSGDVTVRRVILEDGGPSPS